MRVVIDTNVLISAVLKPAGNEARVIAFCQLGAYQLFLSKELQEEYLEVSQRKKFAKHADTMASMLKAVVASAHQVIVTDKPCLCRDPDDDLVLACALSADADYLITGNRADFPTEMTRPTIVNARTFLDTIEPADTARLESNA